MEDLLVAYYIGLFSRMSIENVNSHEKSVFLCITGQYK